MTYFCVQSVEGRKEWDLTKTLIERSDIGTDYERLLQRADEHPRDFFVRVIDEMIASGEEVCVRFEDDLEGVNQHIRHNVENWPALSEPHFGLGWLICPGGFGYRELNDRWRDKDIHMSLGVVALRKHLPALREGIIRFHDKHPDLGIIQDLAISDACIQMGKRIALHNPSLVRHNDKGHSVCGNTHDPVNDSDNGSFNAVWRRPAPMCLRYGAPGRI